jgi:hypothetical protein
MNRSQHSGETVSFPVFTIVVLFFILFFWGTSCSLITYHARSDTSILFTASGFNYNQLNGKLAVFPIINFQDTGIELTAEEKHELEVIIHLYLRDLVHTGFSQSQVIGLQSSSYPFTEPFFTQLANQYHVDYVIFPSEVRLREREQIQWVDSFDSSVGKPTLRERRQVFYNCRIQIEIWKVADATKVWEGWAFSEFGRGFFGDAVVEAIHRSTRQLMDLLWSKKP